MGPDLLWAKPRLLFARAPGGLIYFKTGPIYLFGHPRVQSGVRVRWGTASCTFRPGTQRYDLVHGKPDLAASDPHVKYCVRFTVGKVSFTFRSGTRRSDLFQARPDISASRIRRCNLWPALLVGEVSCAFRQGFRRSDLVRGKSDPFVLGSACGMWARSTVGSSLAYFSFGHPQVRFISGQVRSTLVLESAGVIWGTPVARAKSRVLFDRALGGPI